MAINPKDIGDRYASMTDEALLEIDPLELTEVARRCYDLELEKRNLTIAEDEDGNEDDDEDDWLPERDRTEIEPNWMENAFPASAFGHTPDSLTAAAEARDALEAAGIPCRIVDEEVQPEPGPTEPYRLYRVMVPSALGLQAISILDQTIYNVEVADGWKTHLEGLTDEEFRTLDLESLCAGLLDRVERLRQVYKKESARRVVSESRGRGA